MPAMSERAFSLYRPHPWHGLSLGPEPPRRIHAYVEITPFDPVKYEIDKESGYLRVDRPQRHSSTPPMLYGFVPRTYCGERVAALHPAAEASRGDGDPLDVCVLAERAIQRAEVLLVARLVGGIRTTERGEADDKLIAVLDRDEVWGQVDEVAALPAVLVERLRHYFATYKMAPGEASSVQVHEVYGAERAFAVLAAAAADYAARFGERA
jgi:inorganic pyrophosphatase